jgi:hypothetical protein
MAESSALPILLSRHTCARWFCTNTRSIRNRLGPADAQIRYGAADTEAWLRWRVYNDCLEDPNFEPSKRPLYTLAEAARLVGITRRVMEGRLRPIALLECGHRDLHIPLFRERDCINLRKAISVGEVKIQKRSLNRPILGAYLSGAYHPWAEDLAVEQKRIKEVRSEPAFWSRNARVSQLTRIDSKVSNRLNAASERSLSNLFKKLASIA